MPLSTRGRAGTYPLNAVKCCCNLVLSVKCEEYWSLEKGVGDRRGQIGRTLASAYVLHPHELLIQYFRVPELESRVQRVKFRWDVTH
jgi:hypothetical protein